jgi:hypothetical protein
MKREEHGPEQSAGTSEENQEQQENEEIEDLEAPAETADEVLGGETCGPGPTRLE